jgi:hypothetical protein
MAEKVVNSFNVVNNQINNFTSPLQERSTSLNNARTPGTKPEVKNISGRKAVFRTNIVTLITEGGLNFFQYLKGLGLSTEPNLIVLSSKHHYYYEKNDLKSVRVLINLKKLNLIKHLDLFLNSLCRILPPDAGFVGYFSDNKSLNDTGFNFNRFPKLLIKLNNLLDSKTEYYMDETGVSELLEENGFKVVNMTKIKGHTYFYSHIIPVEKLN